MSSSITGLGTALPASLVSQSDALILAKDLCCQTDRQAKVLEQVYLKSGVQARSTVLQAKVEPRVNNFFQPPTTTQAMPVHQLHNAWRCTNCKRDPWQQQPAEALYTMQKRTRRRSHIWSPSHAQVSSLQVLICNSSKRFN